MKRKIDTFTEKEIIHIISSSRNAKEALERFGYKKTNNAPLIREYAQKLGIDISHYPSKGRLEDLTNQKFGKLTVIKLNKQETEKRKKTIWLCKCDCGKMHNVWAADLKREAVKSCGCLKEKRAIKDLSGQVFGDILVLNLNEDKSGKGKSAYWNVRCIKCNKTGIVRSGTIQSRGSFACDCHRTSKNEKIIEDFLIKNNIPHKSQVRFPDLKGEEKMLSFDFQVKNFLIEYQVEQHYKPIEGWDGELGFIKRQEYDKLKKEYCMAHNITLYEITYLDNTLEKLKEILTLGNINYHK